MATVLVIEDNLDIRENICELLELEGFNVIFAENGKAGFSLAKEKKPDIILCDIMMPQLNGYEVFRKLKDHAATSSIPVIFVTASVEKKDIRAGLAMGAHGYIQKPFDPQELFGMIAECLGRQR